MNISLTIQDCSLEEARQIFVRLADLPTGTTSAAPTEAPNALTSKTEDAAAAEPKPRASSKECGSYSYIDPRGKPVEAIRPDGTSRVYNSIALAAVGEGVSESTVSKLLKEGNSSRKGIRFVAAGDKEDAGKETPTNADNTDLREPSAKGRVSVGEAVKAIKKLKRATNVKPVVAYHTSGEVKYFPTVAMASQYCSVSVTTIYNNVNTNRRSPNGWRFEYDEAGEYHIKEGGRS